jgi:hypothetical protein
MTSGEDLGRQMLHAIVAADVRGEHREDTLLGLGWALLLMARACRELDESGDEPSDTDLTVGAVIAWLRCECDASLSQIAADLSEHDVDLPGEGLEGIE